MIKKTQEKQLKDMIYEEYKESIHEMVDRVLDRKSMTVIFGFMEGMIDILEEKNKKYRSLKELRGNKTKKEVAKDLNISVDALTAYENYNREPRDEVKVRMIEYYRTTYIKYAPIVRNAAPADQSKESCI